MDTKQLEIFIAAARYLSFTETAASLSIAQSTVSYSISSLENELNTKLFIRNKGHLALTQAGRIFYEDACRMTSMMRKAIQHTRAESAGASGTLTIGFPHAQFLNDYVVQLHQFTKDHPFIELLFTTLDSNTLAEKTSDGSIDIAIDREIVFSRDSAIEWKFLYSEDFYAIVSERHPFAKKEILELSELKNEHILAMNRETNPGMFDMITHLFMAYDALPNLIATANCHETTLMRARMNEGIVLLMPSLFRDNMPDDLVVVPINAPLAKHNIGIAWNHKNENPALPLFLEYFHTT